MKEYPLVPTIEDLEDDQEDVEIEINYIEPHQLQLRLRHYKTAEELQRRGLGQGCDDIVYLMMFEPGHE